VGTVHSTTIYDSVEEDPLVGIIIIPGTVRYSAPTEFAVEMVESPKELLASTVTGMTVPCVVYVYGMAASVTMGIVQESASMIA
jgi:hypothetical protein